MKQEAKTNMKVPLASTRTVCGGLSEHNSNEEEESNSEMIFVLNIWALGSICAFTQDSMNHLKLGRSSEIPS